MRLADFERDLATLRGALEPTHRLLARWRPTSYSLPGAAWEEALTSAGRAELLEVVLFALDAEPGSRAVVVVEVDRTDVLGERQPRVVDVAGWPEPGRAAVILVDGHELWPVYPGKLPLRPPKL